MIGPALERAILAIEALEGVDEPTDLLAATSNILSTYGYSAFVLSRLPRVGGNRQPEILLNGWPDGWMARYHEAEHFKIDPVANHCLRSETSLYWTEITEIRKKEAGAVTMVGEASEFGLLHGLCVPIHTALGSGGLSIAGDKVGVEPGLKAMTSLLTFRVWQSLESGLTSERAVSLSEREKDVLCWTAVGKTASEIGTILSISEHTVAQHLKNIRAKLRTQNSAHSVVRALQLKQISL